MIPNVMDWCFLLVSSNVTVVSVLHSALIYVLDIYIGTTSIEMCHSYPIVLLLFITLLIIYICFIV